MVKICKQERSGSEVKRRSDLRSCRKLIPLLAPPVLEREFGILTNKEHAPVKEIYIAVWDYAKVFG